MQESIKTLGTVVNEPWQPNPERQWRSHGIYSRQDRKHSKLSWRTKQLTDSCVIGYGSFIHFFSWQCLFTNGFESPKRLLLCIVDPEGGSEGLCKGQLPSGILLSRIACRALVFSRPVAQLQMSLQQMTTMTQFWRSLSKAHRNTGQSWCNHGRVLSKMTVSAFLKLPIWSLTNQVFPKVFDSRCINKHTCRACDQDESELWH